MFKTGRTRTIFQLKNSGFTINGATKQQQTHRRTLSDSHSANTDDQEQSRTSSEQVNEQEVLTKF
ncbi:unnamed protein product [Absidia cylindrospora]